MQRVTLKTNYLDTISWLDDRVIDWAQSGTQYYLDGGIKELGSYHFGFPFDTAVTCENNIYAIIYQKLGTKGLILKNGKILREINRSYYQADMYEYPVGFAIADDGTTILIHCPNEYCRIDFEDVETGKILTDHPDRKPSDLFHSRFEISADNKTLLSKGWGWHPYDFVQIFNIEECIRDPLLLDKPSLDIPSEAEICTANFINNELVLIGSNSETESLSEEPSEKLRTGQIAILNILTNKISNPITPKFIVGGHLYAIDETFAWDLYDYPKIVNYVTGDVIEKIEDINSGKQISSIMHYLEDLPKIAFNTKTKQVAIALGSKIEVLTKNNS